MKIKVKKKKIKFYILGVLSSFFLVYISSIVSSCVGEIKSNIKLLVSNADSTLADKSFSESAFLGTKSFFEEVVYKDDKTKRDALPNAIDLGENAGFWRAPGVTDSERFQACVSLADEGNIVLMTGFNQQKVVEWITDMDVKNKARREMVSNKGFIFIDGSIGKQNGLDGQKEYGFQPLNVSSIEYKCDDSSFIGGIATAIFLNEQYQKDPNFFKDQILRAKKYFKIDKNAKLPNSNIPMNTIGISSFVGIALPSTLDYMNGLRLGIAYFNNTLEEWYKNGKKDGYVFKDGWLPISFIGSDPFNSGILNIDGNFMSGDFSVNNTFVANLATNYYENGSVAILPIAGPQTNLIVNNIRDQKRRMLCIGVDTEQENDPQFDYSLPDGQKIGTGKILQFSFLKNIKESVKQVLWSIYSNINTDPKWKTINGQFDAEKGFGGFGWINKANFKNRGTGISSSLLENFMTKDGHLPKKKLSALKTLKAQEDVWINEYLNILESDYKNGGWLISGDEFYPTDKEKFREYKKRYSFDRYQLIPMLNFKATHSPVSYPQKDFKSIWAVADKYVSDVLYGYKYSDENEVGRKGWKYHLEY